MRSILVRYVIVGMGMVISVLLSRSLAASGRGPYSYVVAFASSVAWIAHLSIETSLALLWHDRRDRGELVGAAIAVAGASGALAVAVGWGVMRGLELSMPDGTEAWMIVVALAATPGWLLALYLNAVLVNDGRIPAMNQVGLAAALIQLIVLVLLVATRSLTVGAAIALWSVAAVLPALMLVPLVRTRPGIRLPRPTTIRRLLGTGLRYHAGAVALALIMRVDLLILGARVDAASLGVYSLAVALVELAMVATSVNAQVAVHLQVRGPAGSRPDTAAGVARGNVVLATAVVLMMVVAAPWAITLVFGASYEGATGPIIALAPGIVALSMLRPIAVYLTRIDRPLRMNGALVAGLVANVGLNLALIPLWGVIGAGIASSVVYVGLMVWGGRWFVRESGFAWSHLVPRGADVRSSLAGLRRSLSRT